MYACHFYVATDFNSRCSGSEFYDSFFFIVFSAERHWNCILCFHKYSYDFDRIMKNETKRGLRKVAMIHIWSSDLPPFMANGNRKQNQRQTNRKMKKCDKLYRTSVRTLWIFLHFDLRYDWKYGRTHCRLSKNSSISFINWNENDHTNCSHCVTK